MTCFNPVYAWRSDKPNISGKYGMEFLPKGRPAMDAIPLPCGKCIGCASDKSRIWSIRMYHEAMLHEQNSFVTLTYSNNAQTTLDKTHLQRFFKRLRKLYKFRYFAVGEYGSQSNRPHYHAVFFGQDFLGGSFKINDELYGNKILDMVWTHGDVVCAPVNMATCCYVAGYVQKKITDQRPPMKPLMSMRPGIGADWLEKYWPDIAATGSVVIEGKEMEVPNAYILKKERELEHVKDIKKSRVRELSTDILAARKKNLIAKLKIKAETI